MGRLRRRRAPGDSPGPTTVETGRPVTSGWPRSPPAPRCAAAEGCQGATGTGGPWRVSDHQPQGPPDEGSAGRPPATEAAETQPWSSTEPTPFATGSPDGQAVSALASTAAEPAVDRHRGSTVAEVTRAVRTEVPLARRPRAARPAIWPSALTWPFIDSTVARISDGSSEFSQVASTGAARAYAAPRSQNPARTSQSEPPSATARTQSTCRAANAASTRRDDGS